MSDEIVPTLDIKVRRKSYHFSVAKVRVFVNGEETNDFKSSETNWHHFYLVGSNPSTADRGSIERYHKLTLRGSLKKDGEAYTFKWYPKEQGTETMALVDDLCTGAQEFLGITDDEDSPETAESSPAKDEKKLPDPTAVELSIHTVGGRNPCKCTGEPSEDALIQGKIVVFHTFYLPDFLILPRFEREKQGIRIAKAYANDKFAINKETFVDTTEREAQTIIDGDKFGLFRYRLHKYNGETPPRSPNLNWLAPKTYRFEPEDDGPRSELYFRITAYNVIEVREEITIAALNKLNLERGLKKPKAEQGGSDFTPSKLIKYLLGFRYSEPIEREDVFRDGRDLVKLSDVVRKFVAAVESEAARIDKDVSDSLTKQQDSADEKDLADEQERGDHLKRLRERHIVLLLHGLECPKCESGFIEPECLEKSPLLLKLIDGSFLYYEDFKDNRMKPRADSSQPNLGHWENEIVKISLERTLVYFRPGTLFHTRRSGNDYERYWECFARAVQHAISLRTLIHILEKALEQNARQLAELSVTDKLDDGLGQMPNQIALIHEFLPGAREIAVPAAAFRAPHAVRKFEYMYNEVFRLPGVLENIQHNFDEVTSLIQARHERELVKEVGSLQYFLAFYGLLLAALASFYAAPSFIDGLKTVCSESGWFACGLRRDGYIALLTFLTGLGVAHVLGVIAYRTLTGKKISSVQQKRLINWFLYLVLAIISGLILFAMIEAWLLG